MSKRSGEAQAARSRVAPKMKHRLTPRGGADNQMKKLIEQARQEGWSAGYDDGYEDGYEEALGEQDD